MSHAISNNELSKWLFVIEDKQNPIHGKKKAHFEIEHKIAFSDKRTRVSAWVLFASVLDTVYCHQCIILVLVAVSGCL